MRTENSGGKELPDAQTALEGLSSTK